MINSDELLKDLESLPREYITMIMVSAENYLTANLHALRYLCNVKDLRGIYITVNRPYESINRLLQTRGINVEKLFFIDCITVPVSGAPKRTDRCLFISPCDLTDLAVSVDEWINTTPEKEKFLFMDSLSTLLFYNSIGTMAKFSHFFTARMRLWNLTGIFMSLERESDPHFLDRISQFCDRVITIKEVEE